MIKYIASYILIATLLFYQSSLITWFCVDSEDTITSEDTSKQTPPFIVKEGVDQYHNLCNIVYSEDSKDYIAVLYVTHLADTESARGKYVEQTNGFTTGHGVPEFSFDKQHADDTNPIAVKVIDENRAEQRREDHLQRCSRY